MDRWKNTNILFLQVMHIVNPRTTSEVAYNIYQLYIICYSSSILCRQGMYYALGKHIEYTGYSMLLRGAYDVGSTLWLYRARKRNSSVM